MRKVLVSSLVLSLCLGFSAESGAARKKTARATKRATTASAVRARGGNSTTTTSSSSSSGTDITTSTHRFIADGMNYDTKLLYGVKYDLAQMLLPSVSSYYKTNGSEAVNEKLCFGPFMTLTGISSSGDVVSYTAEGGLECQPLLAGYTYSLELKEASNEQLKTFALSRRLKVVRLATDNQTEVDINYMEFEYEPFVNVSNFIPKVVDALNQAKTACSAVNEDMEKLKSNLGWSTGLSAGGMVLSGGATGVGVYNVIKTNQTDSQLERYNQLKKNEPSIVESLWKETSCKIDDEINIDDDISEKIISTKNLECLKKASKSLQQRVNEESENVQFDDDMKKKVQKEVNKSTFEFNKFKYEMDNLEWEKDEIKIKSCKECKLKAEEGTCEEGVQEQTDADYCKLLISRWQLPYTSKKEFDRAKESKFKTLQQERDGKAMSIWENAEKNRLQYADSNGNYFIYKKKLETVNNRISEITKAKDTANSLEQTEGNIKKSVKTSRMLDWVQAGLNAGSLLTSGGSLVFSIQAVQNATSALSNLSECEAKISALNLIYNEYKAELENYGDE